MFHLYRNRFTGAADYKYYPIPVTIQNAQDLQDCARYDHICGLFKDNHRLGEKFISADCVLMDMDNTKTDEPGQWITLDTITNDFQNVPFYAVTSRHHMKAKIDEFTGEVKSLPAPRYHLYFPIPECSSAGLIQTTKQAMCSLFPYFDKNALGVARFFFGIPEPPQVTYHAGEVDIISFAFDKTVDAVASQPQTIPVPRRDTPKPTKRTTPGRKELEPLDLTEVLYAIPVCVLSYDDWVHVGMVLHKLGFPVSLWDAWSQTDAARYHPGECYAKWGKFDGRCLAGGGWLIRLAKQFGYRPH